MTSIIDIIEQWRTFRDNRRAVFNPATLFFIFILFDIVWIFAIAPIFHISTDLLVINGGQGVEVFLMANLSLFIYLFQSIALLASVYLGGEQ